MLRNWNNKTVFENRLIGNFLSGIDSPIAFPDNSAGPDAVFCLGDIIYFVQVKFRESVSTSSAARSVSPEYFYVDKNGNVAKTFQDDRNAILEKLRGKTIVLLPIYQQSRMLENQLYSALAK